MTMLNTHLRVEDFPPSTKLPSDRRHVCLLCGFEGVRKDHGRHDFGTKVDHNAA